MEKRLYRSESNKVIAGVCGGLGDYLDLDPTIIRLVWVVFSLLWGAGVLVYLFAWLIIPLKSKLPPVHGVVREVKKHVVRVQRRVKRQVKKRRR